MIESLNFLLIEDDQIEQMKFKKALTALKSKHKVVVAQDGELALKILKEDDCIPDVIFLDLNMPKINGIEFLSILKHDDNLKYIPVVILSTSSNYDDMLESFKSGIAGYVVKPLRYEDYLSKIKTLFDYWSMNELIRQ